jgi:hypothetical protein
MPAPSTKRHSLVARAFGVDEAVLAASLDKPTLPRSMRGPDTKAAMSSLSPGVNGDGPRISRWP